MTFRKFVLMTKGKESEAKTSASTTPSNTTQPESLRRTSGGSESAASRSSFDAPGNVVLEAAEQVAQNDLAVKYALARQLYVPQQALGKTARELERVGKE
jgi:hypothetical protein